MPADGVDDLDAAYASIRRSPYEFQWQGEQWELPHLSELDYRLQLEIESHDELGAKELTVLFAKIFGSQTARWERTAVPTQVLFMIFERWIAHSGGKLGEDEASTSSSENTGRKSRPTSAASTTASGSARRSSAKKAAPAKKAPAKALSPQGKSST